MHDCALPRACGSVEEMFAIGENEAVEVQFCKGRGLQKGLRMVAITRHYN